MGSKMANTIEHAAVNGGFLSAQGLLGFLKECILKVIDGNNEIDMKHMQALSVQLDETEALLQGGNLSEEQFNQVYQGREAIRQAMADLSHSHASSNIELMAGAFATQLIESIVRKHAE